MLVFLEEEEVENPEKNPQSKARNNNKLNPHVIPGWNRTRATLVGGERTHTTASFVLPRSPAPKFPFISYSNPNHCISELTDHQIKIPTEMMQNLMILHSYILVKVGIACPRRFDII